MTSTVWDPAQYARYAEERSRPFFELVSRIAVIDARQVVDLGCGPGSLTAALGRRWPTATVEGIDSSPQMIAEASAIADPPRLTFRLADLNDWVPQGPVDVIVSNATLQWIPGHLDLLDRWARVLGPGGVLAFQVPGNFEAASHRAIREVAGLPVWRARLAGLAERGSAVREPADYLATLSAAGLRVDTWETTYLHVLAGADPVLDWVKGTALRPLLSVLSEPGEAEAFLAELGAVLRAAYPPGPAGTVFPFRRLFVVGRRPGQPAAAPAAGLYGIHHVQLAMPAGAEEDARGFYSGVLGLPEVPKPPELAARGGAWFRGPTVEVHLGVQTPFHPARKAHPAFLVTDIDGLAERLGRAGQPVTWDDAVPGQRRFHTVDPFGNRIELVEPQQPGTPETMAGQARPGG